MGESASSSAHAGQPSTNRRKCVLIVEDNPLNMKLFSAMIEAQGYEVVQAIDGAEGLDLARALHPALIVMDIQLPSMSGLEVTSSLKADPATRDIAIIATTAFALRGDDKKILASGCDAYMAKPIAISPFLSLIDKLTADPPEDESAEVAAAAQR